MVIETAPFHPIIPPYGRTSCVQYTRKKAPLSRRRVRIAQIHFLRVLLGRTDVDKPYPKRG